MHTMPASEWEDNHEDRSTLIPPDARKRDSLARAGLAAATERAAGVRAPLGGPNGAVVIVVIVVIVVVVVVVVVIVVIVVIVVRVVIVVIVVRVVIVVVSPRRVPGEAAAEQVGGGLRDRKARVSQPDLAESEETQEPTGPSCSPPFSPVSLRASQSMATISAEGSGAPRCTL